MEEYVFIADDGTEGQRIDKFLSDNMPDFSRNTVQILINDERVRVNSRVISKSYKLCINDYITVDVPEPASAEILPENIPLDIVYEDSDLLVVNKPKGMIVHPAAGNYTGTLVNALMYHCGDSLSGINGEIRPGIVHRIDKNTSGLLIVAKNDVAHRGLAEQIRQHSFTREYQAVVKGNIKYDEGTVHAPIGRSAADRKKMAVTDKNSKDAVTHYFVLARYRGYTHLRLRLETGRTHQIRVHMAYIGHPVAGDDVYGHGKEDYPLNGQCLHAGLIGFIHPITGEYMEFSAPLPEYFTGFLKKIA